MLQPLADDEEFVFEFEFLIVNGNCAVDGKKNACRNKLVDTTQSEKLNPSTNR